MIMKVSSFRTLAGTALFFSLGLLVAECKHHNQATNSSAAALAGTYQYAVRGIIEKLPAPGSAHRLISIKTEAIGNFIGPDGKISPMAPMEMDYDLAQSVNTATLRLKEKIAFTYRVNWQNGLNQVSQIHRLPASTELTFQQPAAATSPATGEKQPQN